MSYKVKDYGMPRYTAKPIDFPEAEALRREYGLFHLSLKEVHDTWSAYSDSMAAGWMIPDKESVEYAFNVELEEVGEEW